MKNASVQQPLSMEPSPFPLSSRAKPRDLRFPVGFTDLSWITALFDRAKRNGGICRFLCGISPRQPSNSQTYEPPEVKTPNLLPLLQLPIPAITLPRPANLLRRSHANRRLQMKTNQRLRRNLHLLSSGNPIHPSADAAPGSRPDRSTFPATQKPPEDGPNRSSAAGLNRRILPPPSSVVW